MTDWTRLSTRAALASHRLVGWIYWDPGAIERFNALGVPATAAYSYYIASRGAPLLPAGHQALAAAFYSIHPAFVQMSVDAALAHTTFGAIYEARNDAVGAGLAEHFPELCDGLAGLAEPAWAAVDVLPLSGRVLFGAHRQMPRPDDPVVSGWLAFNCMREWRGDTHFAVLTAEDITGTQAGILDDARRNYGGWIPRSRGADDAALAVAFADLEARGLAEGGEVNDAGLALRDSIEERTDRLTARGWQNLGEDLTVAFLDLVEPLGTRLVDRIDQTAGPNWMPAARDRAPRP